MRTTCKRWSDEERLLMKEHYSKPGGVDLLLGLMNRTRSSLWIQAQRMGLPHYQFKLRGAKGIKGNKGEGARMTVETLKENTLEDDVTGCWNWLGGTGHFGYGKIMVARKTLLTHRFMFSLAFPDVDISQRNVNHHCDNPACINPAHLYAGTQRDNIQDQFKRGRHRWQRAQC